jgi:N-acetylglucosamine-6-phosphate deacetylase
MQPKLIHSTTVFDSGSAGAELKTDAWVLLSAERTEVGFGESWRQLTLAERTEVTDGTGSLVLSGLVDTHCHGAAGFNAQDGISGMRKILDYNHSLGVARTMLSLVSDSHDRLIELCQEAEALSSDERLIGIHLEGPYLSELHPGAHSHAALSRPSIDELEQLLDQKLVSSITIAPELFSRGQLALLRESGLKVCIGHTAIDHDSALEFFDMFPDAIVTHAFNGMKPMHHREPGLIPAAIDRGIFTELIADGVHVHPAMAGLLPAGRVILVTDAMSAAGMPDGDYHLGRLGVSVREGVARSESGSLAGSTLALRDAVTNYSKWLPGADSIIAAISAASLHPAKAYDLELPELSLQNHIVFEL